LNPALLLAAELAAMAAPLLILARWGRIYPSPRAVLLGVVPIAASFAVLAGRNGLMAAVAVDVLAILALAIDAFMLPRSRDFSVERRMGRIASLARTHRVTLTVLHHGHRTRRIDVRDGMPEELRPDPEEFSLTLAGRRRAELDYVLRPARRGAFTISDVHLRARSRWGLWRRMFCYPLPGALHVYPDMQQLSQYALLARTNRLSLVGVRRARRIGQDHDFERLRDYNVDDNYKHLDWRATARRQRLTVKDFQSSQSQRVVFLIDCGRMVTNQAGTLSLLDHALNSILMLSYVALRQGDSAGLLCFSNEIHGFVPPRPGMKQMNRLLHAAFDRFPRMVESRYDLAFHFLAAQCRRRSLVVLVTNVIDEVNAGQVRQYLGNLAGRHLPLGVLLRDRRLFDPLDPQRGEHDLWQAAAAAEILAWRQQALADLGRSGVLTLDVFPESLTAPLVNEYLQIKARHLL
jgi:uncharacterized protein (DUF58 family)